AKDPNADGLLVVLTPQDMTDPTMTAEQLKPYSRIPGKPVLASWMGGAQVAAGKDILSRSQIPTFDYCDTAARIFSYMWRYSYNLRGLYETPSLPPEEGDGDVPDRAKAAQIIEQVRSSGRTILTEVESKELLAAYGIPTVPTRVAKTVEEAVDYAESIGYPVVLKIFSETITHKTDVGGVRLNLRDADAVRAAFQAIQQSVTERVGAEHFGGVTVQPMIKIEGYELIIGSSIDEQLGPVVLFGTGGQLVEVFKDRALALPPLNDTLARRLMEQTSIYKALKGVRGRKPVDQTALEQLLVNFSHLVVEQRWIKECDINPLLASSEQLVALDARVVVYGPDVKEQELPRPAIRPYPREYVSEWKLKDGTTVTIRPIMPHDEPLMAKFHQTLSERTVQLRYFHPFKLSERIAHERLARVCFVDYDRQLVLVAERKDPQTGEREILGVGRLNKVPGTTHAEFALLITDKFQRQGLGTRMLDLLVQYGEREGLTHISADILPENIGMRRVAEKVGFQLRRSLDAPEIRASIDLPRKT
ncbi:MAG: GNAT family N-acetyltransferase, partial [Planctomycetes bacterium]|nr:GNAT family N-acetyltransferase [Planctomycetota bacterium]